MKTQRFLKLSGLFLLLLTETSFVCAQQNMQDASAQKTNIESPTKTIPVAPMNNNKNGNSTTISANAASALQTVERANINTRIKDEITSAINRESTIQNKNQIDVKQNITSEKVTGLEPKPVVQKAGISEATPVVPTISAGSTNADKIEQPKQIDISIEEQQQEKDIEKTLIKASPKKKKTKKVAVSKTTDEVLPEDWSEGSQKAATFDERAKDLPGVTTISFTNNQRLNVALSNKDINRIIVRGDKIQSINGPSGYYSAKNDQQGAAYINTVGESPFTLFISTLKGHSVSLLVHPSQLSGKTVILIPNSQPEVRWEQSDSYQKSLAALMSHMLNNTETDDYDVRLIKSVKVRNFYNIAEVKTLAIYDGSYLYGTISEIKSISKKPITIKPSYFYESGVRAVALSEQTIPQGSSSLMYRIIGK